MPRLVLSPMPCITGYSHLEFLDSHNELLPSKTTISYSPSIPPIVCIDFSCQDLKTPGSIKKFLVPHFPAEGRDISIINYYNSICV